MITPGLWRFAHYNILCRRRCLRPSAERQPHRLADTVHIAFTRRLFVTTYHAFFSLNADAFKRRIAAAAASLLLGRAR
jgi:hypothetical protein